MDFSNAFFLYYFLPVVLLLFYLVPKDKRKALGIISSLFFYAWGAKWFLFIFIITLLLDYWLAENSVSNSNNRKKNLLASIIINSLPLLYFKVYYTNIHPSDSWINYAIPIGLSMIYLQRISYTIDIFKDKNLHFSNIQDYAFFHLFFPTLITGPLKSVAMRKGEIAKEENIWTNLQTGIQRFSIGFVKKIIIANTLAQFTRISFSMIGQISAFEAFLLLFTFGIQLFFELSAYADMSIGLSRMFGYQVRENFQKPYLTTSIHSFWKSWFSSIHDWFKTYLYDGLDSILHSQVIRIGVVFLVSFILLGTSMPSFIFLMIHLSLLVFENGFLKKFKTNGYVIIGFFYTSFVVFFSWIFLASPTLGKALSFFQNLIGISSNTFSSALDTKFYVILGLAVFWIYWSKIPVLSNKINLLFSHPKTKLVYSFVVIVAFLFAVSYATTLENTSYLFLRI